MKFFVWVNDKRNSEADAEVYETDTAGDAVRSFAFDRYSALQHVDPGQVFVRYPDGSLVRWSMVVRVVIDVEQEAEGSST